MTTHAHTGDCHGSEAEGCTTTHIEQTLIGAGVKPTANRILVYRQLLKAESPMSLMELEDILETLEKSSIFRVLVIFLDHALVHAVEDGRGIVRYEVCRGHVHNDEPDSDLHVHFYCEKCQKVFCLENVPTPEVKVPDGFEVRSVNYMIKGICPSCGSM